MTRRLFAFLTLLLAVVLIPLQEARADLTITPTRVVFLPRGRSASVELLNITNHPNSYRIGWQLLRVNAEGKYERVPENDKDPYTVPKMVIFSPRQVTIEPHGEQLIRLSLRRPADLPPGEYRAHLTLTKLARNDAAPVQDPNAKSMALELKVNLSFSIPVIVRQGEDKTLKVSLQSPQLKTVGKDTVLNVDIHRDAGKFSTYGSVKVSWKPAGGKEEKEIGQLNGVALYPEMQNRQVSVPVTTKENITGGTIHVAYIGQLESEGTTWAENTFPVGGK